VGDGLIIDLTTGLGALTDSHHGRSNAVVTLTLGKYNEPACPDKFAEMTAAMGIDTRNMSRIEAADRWFVEIERLLNDLKIKPGHLNEQFGLKKEDLEHIVNIYSNDWCSEGNPVAFNREECITLLESML